MNHYKKACMLTIAITAAAAVAYAEKGQENDVHAIVDAKISLVQAVTVAEKQVKGRATHAEFEASDKGWVYEIEVVSEAKVFDVKVDANTGKLISSVEDSADDDDDAHEHHDEHERNDKK
jgi:uncharacterized membrane protein YkoI